MAEAYRDTIELDAPEKGPEGEARLGRRRGMRPEDLQLLRSVSDPRVSPDGSTVACTVTGTDLAANVYRSRVYLAPSDGSTAARPITAGPSDGLPRFSPDGRLLAFVARRDEGGASLCVLPIGEPGERQVVASWREAITELSWSPDGRTLAFIARDPDPERYGAPGEERKAKDQPPRRITRGRYRFNGAGWTIDRPTRIFVVPADGGAAPRAVTAGVAGVDGLSWSYDSRQLAFCSGRHERADLDLAVDCYLVDLSDPETFNEPRRLTETVAQYSAPVFRPDNSAVAVLRHATPLAIPCHAQLGVIELESGRLRELTRGLDRTCGPTASRGGAQFVGDQLLFLAEDRGNVHCYAVKCDGSADPVLVLGGDRQIESFDYRAGVLSFVASEPTSPSECYCVDFDEADPGATQWAPQRQLTSAGSQLTDVIELVAPEHLVVHAADGTELDCWVMLPPGLEPDARVPALLNVHGGPFTQYGNRCFDEFQLQLGAGYAVIYCNPRGSSGGTEAFGRAIRFPGADEDPGTGWGAVDFDDVMSCLERACERFSSIDPARLGILGGSYGGFFTSWAVSHTDRFVAAVSERACNNLLTMEHNSDITGFVRSYVGRSHLEDPETYLAHSPVRYVDAIHTPLLILHSEEDFRCPINQAEELFVALRQLGREVELVRFPGESHELSRSGSPRHRVQRAEILLEFFDRHISRAD
jgi:dipeptidyl aminopeptidase/acylaminoacyl peptidase